MSINYLVTGGSGYFGEVLVKKLLENNNNVRIVDLNKPSFKHKNLEFFKCDVRNSESLDRALNNIDIVHHNVAQLPISNNKKLFWSVNYKGSQNIINAVKKNKIKKIVYMSSAAIFGNNKSVRITEATTPKPLEEYGKSKLAAEKLFFNERKDFDLTIIRPTTIVGHERYGLFQILFEWILKNYKIPVFDKGKNIYQFIHCDDLADFCLAAEKLNGNNLFNIGTENFGTIDETMKGLIMHAKSKSRLISVPKILSKNLINIGSFFKISPVNSWHISAISKDQYFDISKAKKVLNWKPNYGNIEMICQSYDCYIKNREKILNRKEVSVHQKKIKKGLFIILERFLK